MKYWLLVWGCCLGVWAGAAELRPVPWSEGICVPGRFEINSSGKMTAAADPADNAVNFEVTFAPGSDFWAYPVLRLQEKESLADVDVIRFDFKARQGKADAPYSHAYVMFSGEPQYYSMPEPKAEYQTVTINVAEAMKNPAAVRAIRIGVNPTDPQLSFSIRNLQFLSNRKMSSDFETSDAVKANAPAAAFVQGESLNFELKKYAAVPCRWTLRNWKNEIVREGDWPAAGREPLVLEPLSNGYYQLELTAQDAAFAGSRSFAVVPDPAKRASNFNSFFAMDSAQSWLARPDSANPRQPQDPWDLVSETARRAGLNMVRERMSWAEVEPAAGKYDWKQYKLNADLLAKRDVKVLGMYHDAPQWAKTNTPLLPGDLLATYSFAKKAAETMKNEVTVWEFWNEQDIGFTSESAWDYVAAFKAASLGFKAADPAMPVAIGGLCIIPFTAYTDVIMKNGAGEYFDIFNVHIYHTLRDYTVELQKIRANMDKYAIADRPLWVTENGSRMEGSGRIDSFLPKLKAHSPDQELLIAENLAKMMISLQFLGVERDFFFVLPPYNEGGGSKDWGLMRRDFTVKPGFAAFAVLADKLGNAKLLGEASLGERVKGFVYRQKDGSDTLVYWSRSELDTDDQRPDLTPKNLFETTFSLPRPGRVDGVDLFGTPFVADGAKVTADRFPRFLDKVNGLTVSAAPVAAQAKPANTPVIDKSIVFRTELSGDFSLAVEKDSVDVKTETPKFKLQIWNLSDRPKTGKVVISGGKAINLPDKLTVPAFGKTELELGFTPQYDETYKGAIKIDGVFGNLPVSQLYIPVRSQKAMAESGKKVEMPQMLDPANWHKNSSGQMEIAFDKTESAIRFQTHFPPGVDRWVYPEYILQLPQESLKGAAGIGFEVKVSNAPAVKQMLVMAVYDNKKDDGKTVFLSMPNPKSDWQERMVQFPASPEPGSIYKLRFGLNSDTDDITYLIRNVRIYYTR